MLRVVTSGNPDIVEHLDGPRLGRLGLEHVSAAHYSALEELIRTKHPELAILDSEIRGGSGLQLCRTLRRDPGLSEVRVILVLPSIIGRAELEALSESGCDDVIALPVAEDDFFHHVVTLVGRRHRRNERVAVELEVTLEVGERTLPALVVNMSQGGLGVRLEEPLPEGTPVLARLRHDGRSFPAARAVVAWGQAVAGDFLAGLSLAEVPVETRLLVEEMSLFEVVASPLGGVRAYVHGDIVETTRLEPLARRLADADPIELNLREVRYLSSSGVRNFCRLLEQLEGRRYWFRHASAAFVTQASVSPAVTGRGEVLSLEAPYMCETCEHDDLRLLDTAAIVRNGGDFIVPTLRCPGCGGELVFDELPWRYFAFLR